MLLEVHHATCGEVLICWNNVPRSACICGKCKTTGKTTFFKHRSIVKLQSMWTRFKVCGSRRCYWKFAIWREAKHWSDGITCQRQPASAAKPQPKQFFSRTTLLLNYNQCEQGLMCSFPSKKLLQIFMPYMQRDTLRYGLPSGGTMVTTRVHKLKRNLCVIIVPLSSLSSVLISKTSKWCCRAFSV